MVLFKESDLEIVCHNCGTEHNGKFDSEWDKYASFMHYKTCVCEECGYKISFQAGYDASGRKKL